jgi:hypothetical protein
MIPPSQAFDLHRPTIEDAGLSLLTPYRATAMRPSLRRPDQMRVLRFTRGFTRHAEGSVLVEFGNTKRAVHRQCCRRGAPFPQRQGQGWITAEYGMLPRSTHERMQSRGGPGQAGGTHPGDPAADRPLPARRC